MSFNFLICPTPHNSPRARDAHTHTLTHWAVAGSVERVEIPITSIRITVTCVDVCLATIVPLCNLHPSNEVVAMVAAAVGGRCFDEIYRISLLHSKRRTHEQGPKRKKTARLRTSTNHTRAQTPNPMPYIKNSAESMSRYAPVHDNNICWTANALARLGVLLWFDGCPLRHELNDGSFYFSSSTTSDAAFSFRHFRSSSGCQMQFT